MPTNGTILFIRDSIIYYDVENLKSIKNIKKSPFLEYTDIEIIPRFLILH